MAYNYQDGTALCASSYTKAGRGVAAGKEKESLQEPYAILALEIDMTIRRPITDDTNNNSGTNFKAHAALQLNRLDN